jgi:hypothetical protein
MTARKKVRQERLFVSVEEIIVESDNATIYGNFGIDNADDAELAQSISEQGIIEPLVLSADGVLLSGHRRLAAANYLGISQVPVRVVQDLYYSLGAQEQLTLLRSFNVQRDKTPEERLNEKLIGVDPGLAYQELRDRQLDRDLGRDMPASNIDMGAVKNRKRITTTQFLAAVQKVIAENEQYWPLTDRRVHYLLLNDPPLRHDKKPECYSNTLSSYAALTNLLVRARLSGDISWDAIEDPTRPIQLGGGYATAQEFIARETEYFLSGYSRNLMQGQPHHIEILLEKNALRTVIASVAREFNIPLTVGKGYSSLQPRYDLFRRYQRSGKAKLVLLVLTDFDPDGEQIAESFARSLRDDFGIQDLCPIKVCLTADDVKRYALPSDLEAKATSVNFKKFERLHGTKVTELDAAPVELLQSSLRSAIESVLDVDVFNAQSELAQQDAAFIEAHRLVVFEAMGTKSFQTKPQEQ